MLYLIRRWGIHQSRDILCDFRAHNSAPGDGRLTSDHTVLSLLAPGSTTQPAHSALLVIGWEVIRSEGKNLELEGGGHHTVIEISFSSGHAS